MIDVPPSASPARRALDHYRPQTHRRREIRQHATSVRNGLAAIHRPRQRPWPRTPGRAPGPRRHLPGVAARRRRVGPDLELAGRGDPVLSPAGGARVTDRPEGSSRSARGRPARRRRPRPRPRQRHGEAARRGPRAPRAAGDAARDPRPRDPAADLRLRATAGGDRRPQCRGPRLRPTPASSS
jgi:hypothetical protein